MPDAFSVDLDLTFDGVRFWLVRLVFFMRLERLPSDELRVFDEFLPLCTMMFVEAYF